MYFENSIISLGPDRKKCHLELEKFLLALERTLGIEFLGK